MRVTAFFNLQILNKNNKFFAYINIRTRGDFYGIEKNLNKIIIRDNGQGFMFGRENKIFERYFLGDRTKEGSSGLGLSIAQQVIKQHFGTITASNRECGGAEFLILFPQMDATTIY